jgi:hypothetical protein
MASLTKKGVPHVIAGPCILERNLELTSATAIASSTSLHDHPNSLFELPILRAFPLRSPSSYLVHKGDNISYIPRIALEARISVFDVTLKEKQVAGSFDLCWFI